jgi:superfamily I DNA/RNA helicase
MTPKGATSHVENRIAEGNRTGAPIDAAGLTTAAKVYPEYQTRLREANAADFGDLLLWPTLALVNDADYRALGREVRLGPRRRVSGRQFRTVHMAEDAGVPR